MIIGGAPTNQHKHRKSTPKTIRGKTRAHFKTQGPSNNFIATSITSKLKFLLISGLREFVFAVWQFDITWRLTHVTFFSQTLDTYSKLLMTTSSKPAIQPRPPQPQGKDGLRYHLRTGTELLLPVSHLLDSCLFLYSFLNRNFSFLFLSFLFFSFLFCSFLFFSFLFSPCVINIPNNDHVSRASEVRNFDWSLFASEL